jgi:hypothetical protein
MVGITQYDLGTQILQNVLRNGFDGPSGADRHKGGSFYRAMSGVNNRLAGRADLGLDCEGKSHKSMVQALSEIPSAARNPYVPDNAPDRASRSTHHAASASTMYETKAVLAAA